MKQFEIWWADLSGSAGRRPVLLLSRNNAYQVLNKVIAAEITTRVRHIPIEVAVGPTEDLPQKCVINCDNLRTVSKDQLTEKISSLPPHRISEVKRALGYALGWDELIGVEDQSPQPRNRPN